MLKNAPQIVSITAYTDGSCSWRSGNGGFGIYIQINNDESVVKEEFYFQGFSKTKTGRQELMGILMALKILKGKGLEDKPIVIKCDSLYAINTIKDKKIYLEKNNDIIMESYHIIDDFKDLNIMWIKGHSGVLGNEIADRLANKGYKTEEENRIEDTGNISEFINKILK